LLMQGKENDLAHGEWSKWCESECGMSRNQATKLITIVEQLDVNDSTSNQVGVEAFYLIATLPEEHRDQAHTTSKGEQKKPDEMTVRELRELKRQLREERDKSKLIDEQRKTAERDAPEAYEVGANGGIG
jgi:hypothetical protein